MLDFNSVKKTKSNKKRIIEIEEISGEDIAVIGMYARLPQADDIEGFWDNLKNGRDCITKFPASRRRDTESYLHYKGSTQRNRYSTGAYLEDIDKFDNSFFNITPKEASLMSPNQRIFLEATWKAIEDAGYGGKKLVGSKTGVYIGFEADAPFDYTRYIEAFDPKSVSVAVTGNLTSVIPSRISYLLDLKGPSISIDTACSSALVAVHMACKGIKNKDCEMAIVGSIRLNFMPMEGQLNFGINASDGRAKTFDDSSDGTGSGEGVITYLLKPLSRALKDKDNIHAVIKGSAINQDGRSIGLSAPNVLAQEDVIVSAWKDAGIDPETVSYIEAHGTGTKLGDPIEVDGISRAFRRYTSKKQFCSIGSVKTNIGHLDNAAGVAGMLKAVLSLKNKQLPASLHYKVPNRRINFKDSPVYVNDKLTPWETHGFPRRCGVSSFGFSGTNCHIILEEAPSVVNKSIDRPCLEVLTLSAKTNDALKELVKRYRLYIQKNEDVDIGNMCYTQNTGRWHFDYRIAVIAKNTIELKNKLDKLVSIDFEDINEKEIYFGIQLDNIKQNGQNGLFESKIKELSCEADKKLEEFILSEKTEEDVLYDICKRYVEGANIDWDILYKGEDRTRISLPTYPFRRTRCWINAEEGLENDLFYVTAWESKILKKSSTIKGSVLLFRDSIGKAEKLVAILRGMQVNVIEVDIGSKYKKINNSRYQISASAKAIQSLLNDIDIKDLRYVIHMASISESSTEDMSILKQKLQNGIYSLYHLLQGTAKLDLKDRLNIVVVSEYVNKICGEENTLKPENAAMFGMGKSAFWEYPNISIRCIDIDRDTDISVIVPEISAEGVEFCTGYRNGNRYVEIIKQASIENKHLDIKEEGVYVITGGAGGLGIEFAKRLVLRNRRAKLAFINRSKLPERNDWDAILASGSDEKMCRLLNNIKDMEAGGAEITLLSADVSEFEGMKVVISELKRRYGNINGIIHSAGISKRDETEEDLRAVLSPKIEGAWILDRLTQEENLDFFVMCSSAITLIGGLGGGGYTAANAYLDSFSAQRSSRGKRTLAINWAAWENTGLAEGMTINEDKELFRVLLPENALDAFENALNSNLDRVIIGELNLSSTILNLGEYLPFRLSDNLKKNTIEKTVQEEEQLKDIKLKGKEEQDYTKTEVLIAKIWREVLGFEEFNLNDNFFTLGGDSIMITRVETLLEKHYPGRITISELFAYPTISKLSEYLSSSQISGKEADTGETELRDSIFKLFEDIRAGSRNISSAIKYYDSLEVRR